MRSEVAIVCPGCGANNPLHNPGIVSLVCNKCSIVIYREGAQAKAGIESLLAPSTSGITVGVRGKVRGRAAQVIGRIRMEHDRGNWEEWYCEDGRGQPFWLIEEEGGFKLEKTVEDPGLSTEMTQAEIGTTFRLLGQDFQVVETGAGTVAGGEGQLPRGFVPGERFQYVVMAAIIGKDRLSIEVAGGDVQGFMGHSIKNSSVDFPVSWSPSTTREEAKSFSCSGCGASLDVRPLPKPVKTLTCRYCGSIHSLHGEESGLLGKNEPRKDLHLMIGTKGKLRGTNYEVVGRMVYDSLELDEGSWSTYPTTSFAYLLIDAQGGFVTIEVTDEGVAMVQKIAAVPSLGEVLSLAWGDALRHGSRKYRMYEHGSSELVYVDGALPWIARLGDKSQFIDLIDMPSAFSGVTPERLSVEWTEADDAEIEAFLVRDVAPQVLADAFPGSICPQPKTRILQPIQRSPQRGRFGLTWLIMGAVFFVCTLIVSSAPGDLIASSTVKSWTLPSTQESEVFTLQDGALVEVSLSSNADNSWLYAELDIVDAGTDQSIGFVAREVSYYHGVEGGESWSEGSRDWRKIYAVPKGGQYRLRVALSEAGSASIKATAAVHAVTFDTRLAYLVSLMLLVFGGLMTVWTMSGKKNLWPSDD